MSKNQLSPTTLGKVILFLLCFNILFANGQNVLTDPGNLSSLRSNIGVSYSFSVTGTDLGSVWGGADGVYKDDSHLGKAAVHAGLLKVGEKGVVKVVIIPGAKRYMGSTRNGISTTHYGPFEGSFRFENVAGAGNRGIISRNSATGKIQFTTGDIQSSTGVNQSATGEVQSSTGVIQSSTGVNQSSTGNIQSSTGVIQSSTGNGYLSDPGNLIKFRKNLGTTYSILITGTTFGGVWGGEDGVYTDDSAIARAAVHAGLVVVGEQKVVRVTILPGRQWYNGCSRNGITTPSLGSNAGSYRFEIDAPQTVAPQEDSGREVLSDPGNLIKFRKSIGETYSFLVTGTNQGGVWGGADGIYSDDSALAKAAVHAGLVKLGEQAVVRIKTLPGMQRYTGSPANGITTTNYGASAGSFKFL